MAWTDEPAEMRLESIISSNVLHDGGDGRGAYPVFNCALGISRAMEKTHSELQMAD